MLAATLCSQTLSSATIESIGSGEWNNIATWQGGHIPTENDDVIIHHAVSVTAAGGAYLATAKSLIIHGSFTYESNRVVIGSPNPSGNPNSGGNSTVYVIGSLNIAGDYSNSFYLNGNLRFSAGSTFNMSSGFMVVNGNTGTPLSSVAAGLPIIDFSDATHFQATGGTLFISNPHIDVNSYCIKGAKEFTGGASVSFGAYVPTATANNFKIDPFATPLFQNLELHYSSTSTKLEVTDLTIKGSVSLESGTLNNPSNVTNIRIGSDINFGNTGKIEGRIELNGATQQNINPLSAAISSAQFNGDLIANNAQRVKIKLNLEIIGSLIMSQGRFDLNDRTLTLQAPPTNADENRYLVTHDLYQKVGTLKIKNISSNTLFPVGTETAYAPVLLSAAGGDYSVSARPTTVPVPSTYSKINLEWDIRRVNGNALTDIQVQWNSGDETPDFTLTRKVCRLFRYNGTNWVEQSPVTGSTSSLGTVHTKLVEAINDFAVFTVLSIVPIPVTFVSFTAQEEQENALLTWQVATEINNAGFAVEKSLDGRLFTEIGFVKGRGHANTTATYQFTDYQFRTTAYYRLKQTDFDAKTAYTPIVAVQKNKGAKTLVAYPNPISSQGTYMHLDLPENTEGGQMAIFDLQGRLVYSWENPNSPSHLSIPVENWSRGLYILKARFGAETTVLKVVKN
jgi:hypothetical protein